MNIQCIHAVYGSARISVDVTKVVQYRLAAGQSNVVVENGELGGDPDVGVVKHFGILYRLPGNEEVIHAKAGNEHDTLLLN